MNRGDLTTAQWERLQPLLPPQRPPIGRPAHDHRTSMNGMLWILRTGAPWRDLPGRSGPWPAVASRVYRWQRAGLWQKRLAPLTQHADADGRLDWLRHVVESPISRAHQPAAGAKKGAQTQKP